MSNKDVLEKIATAIAPSVAGKEVASAANPGNSNNAPSAALDGAGKGFDVGGFLKPLAPDLIQKGFQLVRERNFDGVDSLAADNKLGTVGFIFGKTITGIFKTAELSAQANMARTRAMESFMTAIVNSNAKLQEHLHVISKMREETKRELVITVKQTNEKYFETIQKLVDAVGDKKITVEIFFETKKSLDKMLENTKEFETRMGEKLISQIDEAKLMMEIQQVNKMMVQELTLAMVEMSKNDTTVAQTAMQTIKEVIVAQINSKNAQPQQIAGNSNNSNGPIIVEANDKPKPKKSAPRATAPRQAKSYEKYKAKETYEGNAEEKELSFNKGDVLYVYKEKDLDGHRWFKAAKPKADNADQPNPNDKGLVFADYVKKI